MARDLTNKQKQFVLEYLKDLNATQAAIRAGYSESSARQIGADNLSKAYIAEAIQKEMDKRSERVKMTADDVLREIKELAYRNKEKDDRLALEAFKTYGKHLKLFTDKVEHSGKMDMNLEVKWE